MIWIFRAGRRFKPYGIQNTTAIGNAFSGFENYTGSGNFQKFVIPVGQFYTGDFNYLFFIADQNHGDQLGVSQFRNVLDYEDINGNENCEGTEGSTNALFREAIGINHFQARKENGRKVELNWVVNLIEDPIQFEVEVLNQDGVFELIGSVPVSLGNHSDYYNYSFMDHSPRVGENTHRIKVVLEDQIFIYLDQQTVSFAPKIDAKGFPNPTDGQLFIDLSDYSNKRVKFSLSDLTGTEVLIKELDENHAEFEELDWVITFI